MKIGQQGIDLIKLAEGCSSKVPLRNVLLNEKDIACNIKVYPYICAAGCLTIGWGNRVKNDAGKLIYGTDFAEGINVSDCEQLFIDILNKDFIPKLDSLLKVPQEQCQIDALLCLMYNSPYFASKIVNIINSYKPEHFKLESTQKQIIENWISLASINGVTLRNINIKMPVVIPEGITLKNIDEKIKDDKLKLEIELKLMMLRKLEGMTNRRQTEIALYFNL